MTDTFTMPRGAALVTGASTGIGAACVVALARVGFRVYAGVRKQADADTWTAEAAKRAGSSQTIIPVLIDVTDGASIAAAAQTIRAEVGALAGLVNNAGIAIDGPLEFVTLEDWRQQFEVNVFGQVAVIQAFLPLLRNAAQRGTARIVNMGSIGGRSAIPFVSAYCASKFALQGLSDSLRMELQPWNIHVAVIEPGTIITPIWDKARAHESEAKFPPGAFALYGDGLAAMRNVAQAATRRGIPASSVARAVVHALIAPRPKTRYLVGPDARLRAWLNLLPDLLRDRLILNSLGMGKKQRAGETA